MVWSRYRSSRDTSQFCSHIPEGRAAEKRCTRGSLVSVSMVLTMLRLWDSIERPICLYPSHLESMSVGPVYLMYRCSSHPTVRHAESCAATRRSSRISWEAGAPYVNDVQKEVRLAQERRSRQPSDLTNASTTARNDLIAFGFAMDRVSLAMFGMMTGGDWEHCRHVRV